MFIKTHEEYWFFKYRRLFPSCLCSALSSLPLKSTSHVETERFFQEPHCDETGLVSWYLAQVCHGSNVRTAMLVLFLGREK